MLDWIKEKLNLGKGSKGVEEPPDLSEESPALDPELPSEPEATPDPVSTEIGHAWKQGRTHENGTPREFFCIRKGCGQVKSQSHPPGPGICPGGEEIEDAISPRRF